jgi:hypothetical protein
MFSLTLVRTSMQELLLFPRYLLALFGTLLPRTKMSLFVACNKFRKRTHESDVGNTLPFVHVSSTSFSACVLCA